MPDECLTLNDEATARVTVTLSLAPAVGSRFLQRERATERHNSTFFAYLPSEVSHVDRDRAHNT